MDKKEKILKAAMKLLTENGVQATPMSAIAREAETGMGTIYNYFSTKEELINAIYIYIKQDEIKHLATSLSETSVRKKFEHFYKGILVYLVDHPLHFHFMDQFHNSPIMCTATREAGSEAMKAVFELLAEGQDQGIIKPIGVEELLQFLNGGLMGFVRWLYSSQKPLTDTLLSHQLQIAWDAIKQ